MRPLAHLLALPLLALAAQAQLGPPPVPPENPITEAKRVLGKALFWDEQLSSDDTVACGTCHIPAAGGSDPRLDMESRHPGFDGVYGGEDDRFASAGVRRADAQGHYQADGTFGFARQVTARRAPTTMGAAFFDELFWDGRAGTTFVDPLTNAVEIPTGGALETQSLVPILSFVEMADEGRTWTDVTSKLAQVEPLALATDLNPDLQAALAGDADYPDLFQAAFGDPAITPVRIAFALATYQRTLHPDQTPWDLYQQGQTSALTSQQVQGMNSFFASSNHCTDCHPAPFFSDGSYRNLGLRDIAEDDGRRGHTGLFDDRGKFKVPTLRNVALRQRFFHHGEPVHTTLFLAVFLYNQGAGFFLDNKDPILASIFLAPVTASNMTAFLEALTDPRAAQELPPFDRPTLFSELGPAAETVGAPVAGSGGFEPAMVAASPSVVGGEGFRVGVHDALGGAPAWLVVRLDTTAPAPTGLASVSPAHRFLLRTTLSGAGPGGGYGTWSNPIPANPALAGTRLAFQWVVGDPGASGGFAASTTARFTLF